MKEKRLRNNKNEKMQRLVSAAFPQSLETASVRPRYTAAPKDTAMADTAWVLKALALVLEVLTKGTPASFHQLLASAALDSILEDSKVA
jgi:hypothetical protein